MYSPKPLLPISSTLTSKSNISPKAGVVMAGVMMLTLVVAILGAGLLFAARNSMTVVNRWRDYDETLFAAQTALEKQKSVLHNNFEDFYEVAYSWNSLGWLELHTGEYSTNNTTLGDLVLQTADDCPYEEAEIEVVMSPGAVEYITFDEQRCSVTSTVTATYSGITRKIREIYSYTLNRSTVFDHAYFMNNFGWWYGVNIVVNGDIRSNYDMTLRSSSLVINGQSYASGVNNVERSFSTWSAADYQNNSRHENFRPFMHVDKNYGNEDSLFEKGYDYTDSGNVHDEVPQLPMPYIGNLSDYKDYANQMNGKITIDGTVVVEAVYDDVGPSGSATAPDYGCVILEGTIAHPIEIDGPVVIEGDVLIKGYYTGQGTIYAGRNVHILDNLTAVNPPEWNHPDSAANFNAHTLPDALAADFLGLCAKGCMTLGNYNGGKFTPSQILKYSQPPFTGEYQVSGTDASIGYAQYQKEDGKWYFDGDYTAEFGEKGDVSGTPRKYYESSISDARLVALSPANSLTKIDAFIYNNHLIAGDLAGGEVNGGLISRDEALYVTSRLYMNWDARVGTEEGIENFKPYLPKKPEPSTTIVWQELAP